MSRKKKKNTNNNLLQSERKEAGMEFENFLELVAKYLEERDNLKKNHLGCVNFCNCDNRKLDEITMKAQQALNGYLTYERN